MQVIFFFEGLHFLYKENNGFFFIISSSIRLLKEWIIFLSKQKENNLRDVFVQLKKNIVVQLNIIFFMIKLRMGMMLRS